MLLGSARSHTTAISVIVVLLVYCSQFLGVVSAYALTIAAAWAIAAVGLDLAVGYAGQLSFGQAAFLGVGAYGVGVLMVKYQIAPVAALLITGGLVAVTSAILGLVATRLSAFGFAVTTFFAAFVVQTMLNGALLGGLTGGAGGLVVPPFAVFGYFDSLNPEQFFALAILILLAVVFVTGTLVNSASGHALRMMKANEQVAAAFGVNITILKTQAFVYSTVVAALGGLVYLGAIGSLDPSSFGPSHSVYVFAMLVIGGAGTIVGPILGALMLILVPQEMTGGGSSSTLIFAGLMLVFLIFLPNGIWGGVCDLAERFTPRRMKHWEAKWIRGGGSVVRAHERGSVAHHGASESRSAVRQRGEETPRPGSSQGAALHVEDLSVVFGGFTAVSGCTLNVASGELHAVVGGNGAGKTTLLNAVSGVIRSTSGTVMVSGRDVTNRASRDLRQAGLTRTFQTSTLAPDLTALENVGIGLWGNTKWHFVLDLLPLVSQGRAREVLAQAAEMLSEVGLPEDRWHIPARSLTLAEQRHVEIARALAGRPSMVMLDEPTAGLAADEMEGVAVLLRRLRDGGMTILLVAHHLDFVRRVSDSVTVMDAGLVLATGEPDVVLRQGPVREALMGISEGAA